MVWVDEIKEGDEVEIVFKKYPSIRGRVIAFWSGGIHLDLGEGKTMAVSINDELIKSIRKVRN